MMVVENVCYMLINVLMDLELLFEISLKNDLGKF